MPTDCLNIVRGKRVRVTTLETCGTPPASGTPDSYVVTSGFVTVTLSADIEAGDDIVVKNANGDLCISDRSHDQLKRWMVSIDLCEVDPDLVSMMTGSPLETNGDGDVVGFRSVTGPLDQEFALELWSGTEQGACSPEGVPRYGYFLLPYVTGGSFGDLTVENDGVTVTLEDAFTLSNSNWGVGPYNVVGDPAGPLESAIGADEHLLLRTTQVDPPAASCGAQSAEGQ